MREEVSDAQISQCFGKNKSCARECRLKAVCLGKFQENEEEKRRRRYREAQYIDGMDPGSGHVSPDFEPESTETNTGFSADEVFDAIDQLDVSDGCRRELLRIFRARTEGEAAEGAVLELLRRLGEMYVNDQTGFEVLFFQVLAGGNQAALSRQRGCSKQNINKIVAKGKKRLEAYRQMVARHPECRLTSREIAVYHFVAVEKCSYRRTGVFLGIGKDTVRRIALGLSAKGFSCAILTPVPRVVKIFAKIKRGEEVTNAEQAIFEAVCAPERSLRAAAKLYHCSYETIRKMRMYADEKRLLTQAEQKRQQ